MHAGLYNRDNGQAIFLDDSHKNSWNSYWKFTIFLFFFLFFCTHPRLLFCAISPVQFKINLDSSSKIYRCSENQFLKGNLVARKSIITTEIGLLCKITSLFSRLTHLYWFFSFTEAYLEPIQTSMMMLNLFIQKGSIIDVWLGSKYTSAPK